MPQCPRSNTFSPLAPQHKKYGGNIIYFGPMGCRTGFYLLTSGLSHSDAIVLIKETVRFIADYDGKIPGTEPKECGNYNIALRARKNSVPITTKR